MTVIALIADNNQCSAHLINKGVTVVGSNATIEWEGTGPSDDNGPTVSTFDCKLDNVDINPCECLPH